MFRVTRHFNSVLAAIMKIWNILVYKVGEPKWEFKIYFIVTIISFVMMAIPSGHVNPTGIAPSLVIAIVAAVKWIKFRKLSIGIWRILSYLYLLPIVAVIVISGCEVAYWIKRIYCT